MNTITTQSIFERLEAFTTGLVALMFPVVFLVGMI